MQHNLQAIEAIEKFKALVDEIKVAMLITTLGGEEHTRPMSTAAVDEDATLWFFANKKSHQVDEMTANHAVHLVYAHPSKQSYLDIRGTAEVDYSRERINEKWLPSVEAWFPDGKDDQDLCLIKIIPSRAYYWDHSGNKLLGGVEIIASIFTGKKLAEGEEGILNI